MSTLEERKKLKYSGLKFPEYYDVDGTYVILFVDPNDKRVYGKTSTGYPYSPERAIIEGYRITKSDYKELVEKQCREWKKEAEKKKAASEK